MASILVVEDDEDVSFAYQQLLKRRGHHVECAASVEDGKGWLAQRVFDLVLVDLNLRGGSGLDVLRMVKDMEPGTHVIVQTGLDRAESALTALKLGAGDYLVKPVMPELLLHTVEQGLENARQRAQAESRLLGAERLAPGLASSLGVELQAAADSRAPVLVTGESGTGKERVAHLVHELSTRASAPFVSFNAACVSPSLVDAELFGHEPGAFTGAQKLRRGLFEMANGGTLFLDEIGELPLDLQAKLLRVVEGQPFRRVGGEREISTDVRIVSATNRDLSSMVKDGQFRADLHHRLKLFQLRLPPLRDRADDIPVLAALFLERAARGLGRQSLDFSAAAWTCLKSYAWPGNVRELAGVVERGAVLARGKALVDIQDLPVELRSPNTTTEVPSSVPAPSPFGEMRPLEDVVREHVLRVYAQCGRNLSQCARVLGISRPTLRAKLVSYSGVVDVPAEP